MSGSSRLEVELRGILIVLRCEPSSLVKQFHNSAVHFVTQSLAHETIPARRQLNHCTQFNLALPTIICAISIKATCSMRITPMETQKQWVLMNALKHILLLQFPCIYLVKYLAENKTIKDNGFTNLIANPRESLPLELECHWDSSLIESLRDNVSPHGLGDKWFLQFN